MLEQIRDLGRRLEYVLSRYDQLVRDLTGTGVPSPDFEGRAKLANCEVASVAERLQDLFVLEYEAKKAEAYAAFQEKAAAARRAQKPSVVPSAGSRRARVRRVEPFVAAAAAPLRRAESARAL